MKIRVVLLLVLILTVFGVQCGQDEVDADNDGWTVNQGDCNDSNSSVYPGADEIEDRVDNDCDGIIDEGTSIYDDDGDGYTEAQGDCNDNNDKIHPGADDEPLNGVDEDCDGEDAHCDCMYNCWGGDWTDTPVTVATEADCRSLCNERCVISCDDYYCED